MKSIFDMSCDSMLRAPMQWDGATLKFPVNLRFYFKVMEILGAKLRGESVRKAADMWFFMRQLAPLREFRREEMLRIFSTSTATFAKIIGAMKELNLIDIDTSEWAKGYGAPYQYRVIDMEFHPDETDEITLSYILTDTSFKASFDAFEAGPVIKPAERSKDWTGFPEGVYISPYDKLGYEFISGDRLAESLYVGALLPYMGESPSYTSGRVYHAFHRSKRIFRKGFTFEGSHITELFDLHCSFFTLTAMLKRDKMPEDEYKRLFDDCISGQLYDKAATYCLVSRDIVKEDLQAWRNCTINQAHSKYRILSEFMEKNYPTFSKILYEWPTIKKERGTRTVSVKTLQHEVGEYETRVFSKIAFALKDKYNVTCFTLHDAIYVSEKEKAEKLPADIESKLINLFKINIL